MGRAALPATIPVLLAYMMAPASNRAATLGGLYVTLTSQPEPPRGAELNSTAEVSY